MRTTEWIQLGFAVVFAFAAWLTALTSRPLALRRRWTVTALAAVAILVIAATHAARPHLSADRFAILLGAITALIVFFTCLHWL